MAAATAAATAPPSSITVTAAICADPANVVSDITIGATTPMPASRARIPKDMPMTAAASAMGATSRAPATMLRSTLMADVSNMMDRVPQEWNFVQ